MPDLKSPPLSSASMDISSWYFQDSADQKPEELDFESYFQDFAQSSTTSFGDENNNNLSNNINLTNNTLQKPFELKNDDMLSSDLFVDNITPKSLLASGFDANNNNNSTTNDKNTNNFNNDDSFVFRKPTRPSRPTPPPMFSFHEDSDYIQTDIDMKNLHNNNNNEITESIEQSENSENSNVVFKVPGKIASPIPSIRQPLVKRPDSAKNILFDRFQPQLSHPSSSTSNLTGPGLLLDSPQLSPGTHDYRNSFHSPVRGASPLRSSACSIASSDSTITLESSRASSPVSRSRSVSPVRNILGSSPRHHPIVGTFAPSPVRLTPALQQPPPLLQPQPQLATTPLSMDIPVSAHPTSSTPAPAPPSSPSKIVKSSASRSPTRSSVSLASTGPNSPSKHRRAKHGGSISSSAAAQAAMATAINTDMTLASGPPSTPRHDGRPGHSRTQSQTSLIYASPYAFAPPASPSTVPSPVYLGDAGSYLRSVQSSPVHSGQQILMPMPVSYTNLPNPSQLQFVPQLGPQVPQFQQPFYPTGSTSPQRIESPHRQSPIHVSPTNVAESLNSGNYNKVLSPPLVPAPPAVSMSVSPVAVPVAPSSHGMLDMQMQYQFQQQVQQQQAQQQQAQQMLQQQVVSIETPSFEQTVSKIISEGNHQNQVFMQTLEMHNPILANCVRQAVSNLSSNQPNSASESAAAASVALGQPLPNKDHQGHRPTYSLPSNSLANLSLGSTGNGGGPPTNANNGIHPPTNNLMFEQPSYKFPPDGAPQQPPSVSRESPERRVAGNGTNSALSNIEAINSGNRFGPAALLYATGGPGHRKSMLPPGTVDKYCRGPDQDGQFECTFENCGKFFRRRYNVRSHIQTHLCDRPYACDVCPATFVRPHDLRRHMKCHATVKPHICPCGQSFTRHDALSRHRQRMICVGGVETPGKPKKAPGKRGRPKAKKDNVENEKEEESGLTTGLKKDEDGLELNGKKGKGDEDNEEDSEVSGEEGEEDEEEEDEGEDEGEEEEEEEHETTFVVEDAVMTDNSRSSVGGKTVSFGGSLLPSSASQKTPQAAAANSDNDHDMDGTGNDCSKSQDQQQHNQHNHHQQHQHQQYPNTPAASEHGGFSPTDTSMCGRKSSISSVSASNRSVSNTGISLSATKCASRDGYSKSQQTSPLSNISTRSSDDNANANDNTAHNRKNSSKGGNTGLSDLDHKMLQGIPKSPESMYSTPLVNTHGFQSPPKSGSNRDKKYLNMNMNMNSGIQGFNNQMNSSNAFNVNGGSLNGLGVGIDFSALPTSAATTTIGMGPTSATNGNQLHKSLQAGLVIEKEQGGKSNFRMADLESNAGTTTTTSASNTTSIDLLAANPSQPFSSSSSKSSTSSASSAFSFPSTTTSVSSAASASTSADVSIDEFDIYSSFTNSNLNPLNEQHYLNLDPTTAFGNDTATSNGFAWN